MKKLFYLILFSACILIHATASPIENTRKKVGVVLSGGGAKGMAHIGALKVLEEAGIPNSKLFVYVLLTKDKEDNLERIYALRKLKSVTIYGMPYKDMRIGEMPDRWQNVMAQKYIYSGQWRKQDWDDWKKEHDFYFKKGATL